MLSVKDLAKRYQTQGAEPAGGVFGVDLEVKSGEMFTLLGPSGCGKTTTLRCIAGLEQPDVGIISLSGRTLFDAKTGHVTPMYDRDIGMVFQSYAIWPHMSVFENAAYPLRVRRRNRLKRAEVSRRVEQALSLVGLSDYQRRSATLLSGGQQQRLALARALVREPKLLLLDEPLSNLDAQLREQMRGELKRIQTETGVTTIYVTHDQSEAMSISDRIAVMDRGRVAQLGTPDEIYDSPRSEFVASFIGRTNLFRGALHEAVAAGGAGLVTCDFGEVRCRFAAAAQNSQKISFVVRPENVELHAIGSMVGKSLENAFEGRVIGRVYLGEVAEYTIELDGAVRLLARARPELRLTPGERVLVALAPDRTVAICG